MRIKNLVTNSGKFHASEVFACSLIKYLYPECRIYRKDKFDMKYDFTVNIGEMYIPKLNYFDYHFNVGYNFSSRIKIPMSSAGMVYKKYGRRVLRKIFDDKNINYTDLFHTLYRYFVLEIDAISNGISQNENFAYYKYYMNTNINNTISRMNCMDEYNDKNQELRFNDAINFVFNQFRIIATYYYEKILTLDEDRKIVKKAFSNQFDTDVLYLEKKCPNWLKCLRSMEKREKKKIKMVIIKIEDNEYNIRCVPMNDFNNRAYLKDLEQLKELVTKPKEITFIHHLNFVGRTLTLETAKEVVENSLNMFI